MFVGQEKHPNVRTKKNKCYISGRDKDKNIVPMFESFKSKKPFAFILFLFYN